MPLSYVVMRCLVLSNPNSTSLTDSSFRAALAPLLKVADLHARHTQYPGHAAEIVRGLTADDVDVVVVIGGDGTVNEVISGLIGDAPDPSRQPKVAIIPTGSANVFVRALGFPNSPAEAAAQLAELLVAGAYRRLPVGKVNNRWFCINVGFGLDAQIIETMDRLRGHGIPATPWHYSIVTMGAWQALRATPPHIHFSAVSRDGLRTSGDVPFVIVSSTNPWTYAGPVPIVTNPDHSIDDGLSLYALSELSEIGGLRAALNVARSSLTGMRGFPVDAQETRVDDAVTITLESDRPLKWQVDGEFAGKATSLNISTVPNAIDVICPNPAQNK